MKRLIIFILILTFRGFSAEAAKIILKPGQSIQAAVDRAAAGDTLLFSPGTYQASAVTIRKPLSLIGENYPVVDGENKGNIFLVAAENVLVRGLKFIRTGKSNMDDSAAIKFFDSKNCTVENNILVDAFFGLHFSNSSKLTIRNNKVKASATREFDFIISVDSLS